MIVKESIEFKRSHNPLDSMEIGSKHFKDKLIQKMEKSYIMGYSAQNEENWGFTPRLWTSTIKKMLRPETNIMVTDKNIIIESELLNYRNIRLILNCLNFLSDDEWNIVGVETGINKTKLTFVEK